MDWTAREGKYTNIVLREQISSETEYLPFDRRAMCPFSTILA